MITVHCHHCSAKIKVDNATRVALKKSLQFQCPSCSGFLPTSLLKTASSSDTHSHINHNLLILGMAALIVLGGLGFILASKKSGDTNTTVQNIRNEVINNTYFQNLIATAATTKQDLEAIEDIRPYQDGFIGLSAAKIDWKDAEDLAKRTGAVVVDAGSDDELISWLVKTFTLSSTSSAWIRSRGDAGLLTSEGAFALKNTDGVRKVLLHWIPSMKNMPSGAALKQELCLKLEGEDLKNVAGSGGYAQPQPVSLGNQWSGNWQLWWNSAKPGDSLKMMLSVPKAGSYRVQAQFTKAADYGIFDLYLDGQKIKESIDFYATLLGVTGVIDLGLHNMAKGDHELKAVIIGANPLAVQGYMFGLDYVQLTLVTGTADGENSPIAPTNPSGFSRIPVGDFTMGQDGVATPEHTVYVSEFYMAKYETTKELWDEVRAWGLNNGYTDLAVGNSTCASKGVNHPVHSITWYDIVKWCNARSEKENRVPCYYTNAAQTAASIYKTGSVDIDNTMVKWSANGYRLPTEAEWEKAARGGVNGKLFPWGTDTITHDQANYNSSISFAYDVSLTRGSHPSYRAGIKPYSAPVDSFTPNNYGLYNMSGNVWEWCWDWFGRYPSTSQTNYQGALTGSDRVIRSGSWLNSADLVRCANRYPYYPASAINRLGFRLAYGGGGSATSRPLDEKQDPANPKISPKPEAESVMDSWIDIQGREIKARFLRLEGETLVINFKDKETRIPLSRLSPASKALAMKRHSESNS